LMTTPCAPAPSCCSVFCQTEWQWCFQKPLCFVLKHRIHIHIQLRPYNTADRSTAASREPRAGSREPRAASREARGRGRPRREAGGSASRQRLRQRQAGGRRCACRHAATPPSRQPCSWTLGVGLSSQLQLSHQARSHHRLAGSSSDCFAFRIYRPFQRPWPRHKLCAWGEPTRPGVGSLSRRRYTQCVEHN
jgi:hypothetical protein